MRAAVRDVPAGEAIEPTAYEPPPAPSGNAVARFAERVSDYRATVREADGLAETIAQVCAEHDARRLGVPVGLLEGWRPDGLELVEDDGLSARDLDALDGALTGCALAIAETGTIVLDGGERSGRRALTLVPDLHVCVVERSQVVATVSDAIRALEGGRGPFTFVSGRAPRVTSSSTASRASTARGGSRCCWSSAPGPGSCARP